MKLILGCVFTSSVIEIAGQQIAVTKISIAADGYMFLAVWRDQRRNILCVAIKLPELCNWFIWLVYRCLPGWHKHWLWSQGRVPEAGMSLCPPISATSGLWASPWAGILACSWLQEVNEIIQMHLCENKNATWFSLIINTLGWLICLTVSLNLCHWPK